MSEEIISVIVPVYNVEKYIDKCVLSIIHQTYKLLDIILVDDGSTDRSGYICDNWAEKDSRLRVIHKENGGLSDARNAGLKIARGKLIGFVDSDDYIHPQMYEKLYDAIITSNSDAALCGFESFSDCDNEPVSIVKDGTIEYYSGKEISDSMVLKNPLVLTYSVWKCLYRKETLLINEFPKNLLFEDVVFNIYNFSHMDKVAYIKDTYYYYRKNVNSITGGKITLKHLESELIFAQWLLEYYEKDIYYKKVRQYILDETLYYKRQCLGTGSKELNRRALLLTNRFLNKNRFSICDNKNIKSAVGYLIYRYIPSFMWPTINKKGA